MRHESQMQLDEQSETTEDSEALSQDDIFELLSNHRRRYVIHYLKQRADKTAVLSELSEQIAAWENDTTLDQITTAERKRVYNSLQQYHLSKMHTSGAIDYDRRRGHVKLTPEASVLDIHLDVIIDKELPWSWYYLGVSSLCLTLIASALVGLYPQPLPEYTLPLFITAVFLLSAIAHIYTEWRMRLGTDSPPPSKRTR